MKVSSLLSTISYNSIDFLLLKLNHLIYIKDISHYEFIVHEPDNDDKKKHIHLLLFPLDRLDLSMLNDLFIEPCQLVKKSKRYKFKKICYTQFFYKVYHNRHYFDKFRPLKCLPFRKTNKYGDWYWYILHDKDFLRAKLLERNTFYSDDLIYRYDSDFHNLLVAENPKYNFCIMGDVALVSYCVDCVKNNISLADILKTGLVPLSKTQQFCLLYNNIFSSFLVKQKSELLEKINQKKKFFGQLTEINNVSFFDLPFKENIEKDILFD